MATAFTIRPATPAEMPLAAELFRDYVRELAADLSFQDFEAELAKLPGYYAPPRGALLLAFDGQGAALGCVAMRPMTEAGICEMKRLHVRGAARRQGLGRALAEAILTSARTAGYRAMRLDTLVRLTPALALYRDLGFDDIPPYYDNPLPGVVYLEKVL